MKNRCSHKLSVTCFLFCCGVSLVQGQNSETRDDTFTAILNSGNYGLSQESIEEIVQIRQRLGGGTRLEVGQPFKSIEACPKPVPTELVQFESALACELPDPASSSTESERLFFDMIHSIAEPAISFPADQLAYDDSENIPALRSVARRIDELAADLEEINQFEHADSLRLRATKLRHQARVSIRSDNSNTHPMR